MGRALLEKSSRRRRLCLRSAAKYSNKLAGQVVAPARIKLIDSSFMFSSA